MLTVLTAPHDPDPSPGRSASLGGGSAGARALGSGSETGVSKSSPFKARCPVPRASSRSGVQPHAGRVGATRSV